MPCPSIVICLEKKAYSKAAKMKSSVHFAPVVHFGTTILALVGMMIFAKKFSSFEMSALRSEILKAERLIYKKNRRQRFIDGGSILIAVSILISAFVQAVFGTICSFALDRRRDSNLTVESLFQTDFFGSYSRNSNAGTFLTILADDDFTSGVLSFCLSNYSVLVWAAIDAFLMISLKTVSNKLKSSPQASDIETFQHLQTLWRTAVEIAGFDGINTMLLAFYASSTYFTFAHTKAIFGYQLIIIWNNFRSSVAFRIYLGYQIWALFRQILRISLVSHFASKCSFFTTDGNNKVSG